ncbi:Protein kinase domain-containing protein 24 [Elsinoe fawcettii]|nr:Protein kinase domain-containing protein 24 [Elsinoe fawcettii]
MFSSALKSFSSNITSNYSLSPQPISYCGPWKIFEAKRKSTGKAASVFVFDKKSLEPQGGGLGGRSGASSVKAAQQEVLERLKREASSLARLRHPNILELAEPVEETRNGGLMFATEPVTASLAALLAEQDDQEKSGGARGWSSKYIVREAEEGKAIQEFELDELEIQKGLLQIGKGLEFLHESAGLVHGNLTPDAIIVNAKGDWKITGMSFTGPASDSDKASSTPPIYLSEVLNHDPRLPQSVQLNLDFTSPDFVLDNNLTSAADMFSLGLVIISLYNTPHESPVKSHGSLSSYKRTFASSSTVPSVNNNFLAKAKFPQNLATDLLPKLITRRPAQRLTARTFQEAQYFDNILVSTIRFLDSLPAKSVSEKNQFLKGLPKIMPQFPSTVLEKKVLPALLEEMKDKDLLAAILQNVFAIIKASPDGKRPFIDKVIPKLREVFIPTDILPIITVGLSSSTHAVVDAALSTLPFVTPKLDYTTIKNELFPVIAGVFAHTNSLAIKIRGLEAFNTLCGGSDDDTTPIGDGLDGSIVNHDESRANSSAVLDKFTIQEKIIPLMKGIKTKEPAVMMAAMKVFRQVGKVVDTEFIATDILPILWTFALGPLLDLQQFQTFMTLIKSLSARIEREHSRKLQELGSSNAAASIRTTRTPNAFKSSAASSINGDDVDFASLVSGRKANDTPDIINDWDGAARPNAPSNERISLGHPRSITQYLLITHAIERLQRPSAAKPRWIYIIDHLDGISASAAARSGLVNRHVSYREYMGTEVGWHFRWQQSDDDYEQIEQFHYSSPTQESSNWNFKLRRAEWYGSSIHNTTHVTAYAVHAADGANNGTTDGTTNGSGDGAKTAADTAATAATSATKNRTGQVRKFALIDDL